MLQFFFIVKLEQLQNKVYWNYFLNGSKKV